MNCQNLLDRLHSLEYWFYTKELPINAELIRETIETLVELVEKIEIQEIK